jgi:translation elongation factor EF-1alpha
MKKLVMAMALALIVPMLFNCASGETRGEATVVVENPTISVYYFHYTRRCATCNAVEDETKKALNELYSEKIKSGDIIFKSINIEEKSGEEFANKLEVAGQSLLIVKGNTKVDITEKGFLYAVNEPAKLKAEIKKVIDSQL